MQRRVIGVALLLALTGCPAEPTPLPTVDAGRLDAAPDEALLVLIRPLLPGLSPDQPLRYAAHSAELGLRLEGEVPVGAQWPRELVLAGAGRGSWQVVVFWDRDADGLLDDCPFPPRVGDPERAGTLDSLSGRVLTRGAGQAELIIEQRLCGPGQLETGLMGEVRADELVPGPIVGLLAPLDEADEAALPALRFTFQNEDLAGTLPFNLGEMLPGRWRLTAFADADGDATPTPCDGAPGGGDRYTAEPVEVEVLENQRVELPPLVLRRRDCPDDLTGLVGEVALAPGLVADPRAGGPLGPLAGPIRLALFPSSGGDPVAALSLLASVDARPLPHRFTVTGLPVGVWRLVIWVDRDEDGAFTPCGGPTGIDAVWLQQEDVRVVEGELLPLPALALVQHPCDARAETGLTGRVRVEAEDGPVGSGRPVRLELRPQGGGELRRVPLLDNHKTGTLRFIVGGLPAGRHDLIFHLDNDRDGVFVDCRQAPYADRAAVAVDDVDIPAGQIVEVPRPLLSLLGCSVPRAELRPRVLFDARVEPGIEGPLRLQISERGGYFEERLLLARHGPGREEPLIEPIRLAPGEFQLTVFLDTAADERLGECGDEAPDGAVARLTLRLDAANPQAEPLLVLEPPCP